MNRFAMVTERQYIIMGAGGHAAVIADILYCCGLPLKGYLDDAVPAGTEVLGAKVLGKLSDCSGHKDCLFIIGIGDNGTRRKVAEAYSLDYGKAIHPSAVIGREVEIGCGTAVMAGCVINPRTAIGKHCIINTKAGIDHDNKIGDYVHISPGASLGGTVIVGASVHVGIGASVRNNVRICEGAVIGAGAAVVRDIMHEGVYIGVPAAQKSNQPK